MKNFALLFIIAVALLSSCEDDIAKRQAVFTASMPADDLSSSRLGSIINGVPEGEVFNLNAQWKEGAVNRDKDYDIIGVTGVEAYIEGEDVIASCTLTRAGIDDNEALLLPMWFTAKKGNNQAKFRHMCAYEVLYVNNSSESSITFRHAGFNVLTPWYKYSDRVVLTGDVFSGYEAGQNDIESNEITIDAWETGAIVTRYIPAHDITDESTGATIDRN